jgi:hypothetical protein
VERIEWGPGTWGTGEQGPRFPRLIKDAAGKVE